MFNEPQYSFVIGLVCAILFFAIQILLCFKARKTVVKLIPVFFIFMGLILCLLLYSGIMGTGSGVIGNVNQIVALLFTIVIGIACIGDIAAWAVYGIYQRAHRQIDR
jgi:small-conductance mechanosensitive channel